MNSVSIASRARAPFVARSNLRVVVVFDRFFTLPGNLDSVFESSSLSDVSLVESSSLSVVFVPDDLSDVLSE